GEHEQMRAERKPRQTKDSLKTDESERRDGGLSGKVQRVNPILDSLLIRLTELHFDVVEIQAYQSDGGDGMYQSGRDKDTGQRSAVRHHEKDEIALHIAIIQLKGSSSRPKSCIDPQQDSQNGNDQRAQHEGSAKDCAQSHLHLSTARPEEDGNNRNRRFGKCGADGCQYTADRAFGQIESLAHPLNGVREERTGTQRHAA